MNDEPDVATRTYAVRLDMPSRAYGLLRLIAAYEKKSMAAYARDSLWRLLEDEAKRRGVKL